MARYNPLTQTLSTPDPDTAKKRERDRAAVRRALPAAVPRSALDAIPDPPITRANRTNSTKQVLGIPVPMIVFLAGGNVSRDEAVRLRADFAAYCDAGPLTGKGRFDWRRCWETFREHQASPPPPAPAPIPAVTCERRHRAAAFFASL